MAKAKAATSPSSWAVVDVPLSELKPDPRNARRHDARNLEQIRRSIEQHGVQRALVVQRSTMTILAGNGQYEVMRERGDTHAPCRLVDWDDMEARAFSVRDNRTAELAEWDEDELNAVMTELEEHGYDLNADLGFDDDELEAILGGEPEAKPADPPAPAEDPSPEAFKILVLCGDEGQQAKLLERLVKEGFECRALVS